jgi:protein-histidine N-methyltransferase
MAFSFGFSGDDIEQDPNDVVEQNQQEQGQNSNDVPPPIAARTHDLDELVGSQSCFQPLFSLLFTYYKLASSVTIP